MNPNLPALSIRQPWAISILQGGKDIENRSWDTKFRGKFLIHAAGKFTAEEVSAWRIFCDAQEIPMGWAKDLTIQGLKVRGIVGEADLVDVVTESTSPWFCGPYGFVLRNVKPLPFVRCRGALGFFKPDYDG